MTLQSLFISLNEYALAILLYFIAIPILSWLVAVWHKKSYSNNRTINKLLSGLIFSVSIPGLLSLALISYSIVFTRQNLLEVNLLIYFLPLISMITSLIIVSRYTHLSNLPGIERLWALIILMLIIFVIILVLFKLRIIIGFFGSLTSLAIIAIVFYFIFNWAKKKLFR